MAKCQDHLSQVSMDLIILLNYVYVTSEQAKVENLENHVGIQDLTIDALKKIMNDRFASVEKNFEAISPGNVRNMI